MQGIYQTKGILSEIQRFSVHDGPGIRSLLFLKGCPLRCQWCCNPENINPDPETITQNGVQRLVGKEITVEDIMHTVIKDMIYYRRSGGGITLSGGEALFQPDFTLAILKACKDRRIHTAIETTGCAKYDVIEKMLPYLDLVLYDIKHVVDEKHREFTGQSNRLILENAMKIGAAGADMIIRVPVVPTFNATKAEIQLIAMFAAQIPGVKQIHLLPYHRLGQGKYEGLDRGYKFADIEPLSVDEMHELYEVAKISGLHCQIGG